MAVHPTKKSYLSVISWNANGLQNSLDEFRDFLEDNEIDIALVCETHLKSTNKSKIRGYDHFRQDRIGRLGGGTIIYVKRCIQNCIFPLPHLAKIEAVGVRVTQTSFGNIVFIAAYNNPQGHIDCNDIHLLTQFGIPTFIGGDLNSKHTNWNSRINNRNGCLLQQCIFNRALQIHSSSTPTYYPNNPRHHPDVLDVVITKDFSLPMNFQTLQMLNSDHVPVLITINKMNTILYTPRKVINWEAFQTILTERTDSVPLLETNDNIESEVSRVTNLIQSSLKSATKECAPTKNPLALPTWIKQEIRYKNRLRKIWQLSWAPEDKVTFKRQCAKVKSIIKIHKQESWNEKLISLTTKDNSIWNIKKTLQGKNRDIHFLNGPNGQVYTPEDISENLAKSLEDQFKPNEIPSSSRYILETEEQVNEFLRNEPTNCIQPTTVAEVMREIIKLKCGKAPGTDLINNTIIKKLPFSTLALIVNIFNAMFKNLYFPKAWKTAVVVSIHKSGLDPKIAKNYRPISLLCNLSKLWERVFLNRLENFLQTTEFLNNWQFGFRTNHSSVHQIHRVVEFIADGFNKKEITSAVFLDVAKAFDKVWFEGLISKMIICKFPNAIIHMINAYLRERKYKVMVKDKFSSEKDIFSGVPQGSLLGPTLFNIYVNDIVKHPSVMIAMYADDTAILSKSLSAIHATNILQKALFLLEDWFTKWRIAINTAKSNHVVFHPKGKNARINSPLLLFNDVIPKVDKAKYLGVILDKKLTWKPHIASVKGKAIAAQINLYPLLNKRSEMYLHNKLLLFTSIIRPIFAYSCPVWFYAGEKIFKPLQVIQNKFLRLISGAGWFVRNRQLHRDFRILTVNEYFLKLTEQYFTSLQRHPNSIISELTNYNIEDIIHFNRPKNYLWAQTVP